MTSRMALFHKLWTRAVGSPGYVKDEWRQLCAELEQLERDANAVDTIERILKAKS